MAQLQCGAVQKGFLIYNKIKLAINIVYMYAQLNIGWSYEIRFCYVVSQKLVDIHQCSKTF